MKLDNSIAGRLHMNRFFYFNFGQFTALEDAKKADRSISTSIEHNHNANTTIMQIHPLSHYDLPYPMFLYIQS